MGYSPDMSKPEHLRDPGNVRTSELARFVLGRWRGTGAARRRIMVRGTSVQKEVIHE